LYAELFQYLLQHKQVQVPGIGIFFLERSAASGDFPNKQMNPPAYAISLRDDTGNPSRHLFGWLASVMNITDREAIIQFNDFVYGLRKQINEGRTIRWSGVGELVRGLGGDVKFTPERIETFEAPITVEKVLRENAAHTVRVGEDERTSAEMQQLLAPHEKKTSYTWAWALALIIIAIIFIGWYFSTHGLATSSTANGKKLVPYQSGPTYKPIN
jgi:hypothetical protein